MASTRLDKIEIQQVARDANEAADLLAKQALSCVPGFHPFNSSFEGLDRVLERDRSRLPYISA